MRAEIEVSGIVQGVGFRPFIYRIAVKNRLVGYVRNRGDAVVEIVVEGKEKSIKNFLENLKKEKPPQARIYQINVKYNKSRNEFKEFKILKSSKRTELSGSIIPPDISICDECLKELKDPRNKRYKYFFITCTNCGPRYTIIERLPYDRPNTTMKSFPMCSFCRKEYVDPLNRRFHAQTVACKECGPKVYLTDNRGETLEYEEPILEAGKLLEEGFIVAIKGYGGFHVASATTLSEPIARLRKTKHRVQKPFAIMARDLETVKTFAEVNSEEEKLLTSYIKPIVLLRKSENYYLSDLIAPGLHNVGVMLPYTGLHVMLFDGVKEPAFVMTSANPPNEPIIKDNDEALKRLKDVVDYFLFHNREIAQRCDDSVVRLHDGKPCLIRRSRGYVPEPIFLKQPARLCSLGLGGELNVTSCILIRDRAFLSQHIGDVENLETLNFLREATQHLIKLTNSRIEAVACDLHPKFVTTGLAKKLGDEMGYSVIQVQHHYAHALSLMAECGVEEIVCIVCDGYGYGVDGKAWGGEVLYCGLDGFKRLGHLEEQPMVGGDLATRYPLRMAAGVLSKITDISEWLISLSEKFPHGKSEVEVILKQLRSGAEIKTTSCGRILDAVSAILGICYERTYEGEPAMKLEAAASKGRNVLNLTPEFKGNVLQTTSMIYEVFMERNKKSVADLAYSAQLYLAEGLAQLAMEQAEKLNVKVIGFSGGVAHNEHITKTIQRIVESNGFRFLTHRSVPPGDGGISLGQAFFASFREN